MKMGIVSFLVGTKIYKFKEHLMLESENAENLLCLTHKELKLSACGKSWGECDRIIRDQLALIWGEYAMAPDKELSADAIVLKNKLLAMVEEPK